MAAKSRGARISPQHTFIITGANSGLGLACSTVLAADPQNLVILACRNVESGEQVARLLPNGTSNAKVIALDLANQSSIRAFVTAFRAGQFPPLAGLVCNAGGQNVGAPTQTEEGYESTFGVNHLGHYLLSRLLLTELSTGGRITFVSSGTHDPAQKTGMPAPQYTNADALAHDFEAGGLAGRRRYTTSKLCNVYTTYEYARRFAGSTDPRLQSLRVNAFDPGLMPGTGLARTYSAPLRFVSKYIFPALSVFIKNVHTPKTSGRRLALLATGTEAGATGKYFSDGREVRSSTDSYDLEKARELWDRSAEMTGVSTAL
ncbi:MAG: SDR family NAD(P)-dependent oxidoreductase [Phycisphaerae bacterium]|nr:SDR family NAD(P)-dependent oxidoreductase [Gemmatimonadaceae bacterium]